jgi:hypothetical protein
VLPHVVVVQEPVVVVLVLALLMEPSALLNTLVVLRNSLFKPVNN